MRISRQSVRESMDRVEDELETDFIRYYGSENCDTWYGEMLCRLCSLYHELFIEDYEHVI